MMKSSDILPMYPGYALGGIIREEEILLPLYEKKRLSHQEEIAKLEQEKEKEKESEKYKLLDPETKQEIISNFANKIIREKKRLSNVCKAIEELLNRDESFLIEEALPLDESMVKLENKDRTFKSERMDHLVFTSKDQVLRRIHTFISQLFLQDAPSSILPFGTLEAMAKNIEQMLGTNNTCVTLIGSFITLERVKVIEPIIIRPNTLLSANLIRQSAKYYVLCEAVLGGVFLGLTKEVSVIGREEDIQEKEKKWHSSIATISYVSQGAIPKLNPKVEEVNLWGVYNDWKESLISNPNSGYPLGFKIRRLQDVLMENQNFLTINQLSLLEEVIKQQVT